MAKKKKKKSRQTFYIWLIIGIVVGILSGIGLENAAAGFGITMAFAGFAWVISGIGMQ